MQDKITLAIDALASAAFVEGGVSPENTQAARDLTEQRKRELLAAIGAPCLHQIQEPAAWHAGLGEGRAQAAPAAVAVPDELIRAAKQALACMDGLQQHLGRAVCQVEANALRAALAATPANCDSLEQLNGNNDLPAAAPVVLPEPDFWVRPGATIHPDRGWQCWSNDGTATGAFHADTVRALLAAAPLQPVEGPTKDQATWCSYIAGMIGCYLKEPDDSPRVKAIEGIIARRLWALPSAATATGLSAQAVAAPTAQDSCCAWSVWWTHDKAKHTTTRQASIAAWDAGIAYALERAAPQAQADARDVLTPAARDVLAERQRQISVEGWTPEHDDEHGDGSMAFAAAAYAVHHHAGPRISQVLLNWTGWCKDWWKPKGKRQDLIRAGALIQAEIERIDRAAIAAAKGLEP